MTSQEKEKLVMGGKGIMKEGNKGRGIETHKWAEGDGRRRSTYSDYITSLPPNAIEFWRGRRRKEGKYSDV